jgi:hypothetical protein
MRRNGLAFGALAILLTLVLGACSHASVGVGLSYEPIIAPVRFSLDFSVRPDGSISFSGSAGIVTEAGVFAADINIGQQVRQEPGSTVLVIRHIVHHDVVDSVFRIRTSEEIVVRLRGRTTLYISAHEIAVDALAGRVTDFIVRNAQNLGRATFAAGSAPPPVAGDLPPASDPGQLPLPSGSTVLGRPNLGQYCASFDDMHAVLRYPVTWGWRCSASAVPARGERAGDQDIDVAEACIQQYGANAISHDRDYSDPYSWYCYDG